MDDLTGKKFGRLYVLREVHSDKSGRHWYCLCSCKKKTVQSTSNLTSGGARSCGCLRSEVARERMLKRHRAGTMPKNLCVYGDSKRKIAASVDIAHRIALEKWEPSNDELEDVTQELIAATGIPKGWG